MTIAQFTKTVLVGSMLVLLGIALGSTLSRASDKVVIFNDAKQNAMIGICDAAIRASGYSVTSRNAFAICDEMQAASVVTEQKQILPAPDTPKDPPQ